MGMGGVCVIGRDWWGGRWYKITNFDTICYYLYDIGMNVSLTPEIESWVQERVESGFYQSASEVIRESVRFFRIYERERETALQDLRGEIMIGMHQLENGKKITIDDPQAYIESIKTRGRERMAQRSQA